MPKPDDILFRNPSAAFDEDKARRYINSDPHIARGHLHTALAAIHDNTHTDFNADTAVQLAGIWQLEARTHVLDAMRPAAPRSPLERADSFRRGITALHGHALDHTTPYVSGKMPPRFTGGPSYPHDSLYRLKLRAVHGMHAKTLSMLARVASAQEVALKETTPDTMAHRARYYDAHLFALEGDDATTLIENTLFAARDARKEDTQEGKDATRWWIKHVFSELLWALRHDPKNFTVGVDQFRKARVALRSAETARQAILAGA